MNAENAKTLLNFFVPGLESEIATTKKVIRNVPDAKMTYRPDPKAKSAHELAWHIASVDVWFLEGIIQGKFDMPGEEQKPPATIEEILNFYETNMSALLPKLKAMKTEDLAKAVPFFGMEFPNVSYLNVLINHSVHHRGQLSTYLRPMGSTVPSIYGGSADEPFQG
jgi:uncharacterized damage-inducible protein DinB